MDDLFKFRAVNIKTKEAEYIDNLYWFEENQVSFVRDGIAHGATGDYLIDRCTGKYDANGRLIYENDILLSPDFEDPYPVTVRWHDELAAFDIWVYCGEDDWSYRESDDTMEDMKFFTIDGNWWQGHVQFD